jgi:TRAP-type C4-dicarboxylate transport system permease small subunit
MAGICFGFAVGILVAGIAATVLLQKMPGKKIQVLSCVNCLMATVFLTLMMLVFPIFAAEMGSGVSNTVKSIMLSVPTSVTVFLVDCDYSIFTEFAQTLNPALGAAYGFLSITLLFAAPLLTFGFILSFFKNIRAYWRLFWSFRADLYVFSELNAKALTLAADIKTNHPRAKIIFAGVG